MRNRTIWESANRPLLVRSVWNASCGGYRHFILDFEPERRLSESSFKRKRVVLKPFISYDEHDENSGSLQLVGSSKPQNRPNPSVKFSKPISNLRKVVNSPPKTFLDLLKKRGTGKDEHGGSRRSSLQDLHADNSSGSDEKLAERVLNWLDLAGKTPMLRPNTAPDLPLKRLSPVKKEKDIIPQQMRPTYATVKRPDSVKHITIIFNKEGIPIRYNRPIRYTDLFRIGFNASRRFASSLAASRLRKITENNETAVNSAIENASNEKRPGPTHGKRSKGGRVVNVRRNFESDYRALISRKILEESCNLHEMKKQLHIFMPSLPKKSLLNPPQTDCASSMLSGAHSDHSKA